MRKVSGSTPKEMLLIGGNPAIFFAIEEGFSAGINNFSIIISPAKEIIREFLSNPDFAKKTFPTIASRLREIRGKSRFAFFYQNEPRGEIDAISLCREILKPDESVAIIYPDNIYLPAPGALIELIQAFEKLNGDIIALTEVKRDDRTTSNAGRVDLV